MSNHLEQALLSLTKAALWSASPATDGFPLDEDEWLQLHFMAQKQTVEGIVYDAICLLPEDLLPPDHILMDWMEEVQRMEAKHRLHVRTLAWFTGRMEEETPLKPIILKGLPIGSLYPTPSHRTCGDIDIFYGNAAACTRANYQVESWGIPVLSGDSGEYAFLIGEIPIEHHSYMSLSHVPWRKKSLTSWVEHECSLATGTMTVEVEGMSIKVLSPILDMVQLASHSLKHALNEGIGLRQLCDMALYVNRYHDIMQPKELRQALNRFGLLRWTDLCLSYCTTYLGLQESSLPYSLHCSKHLLDAMHEEVMLSGNFGQMDERYQQQYPTQATQKQTAKRILRNVRRYIGLSPLESTFWLLGLAGTRTIEKIQKQNIKET